jgi:hypothetical protein
MSLHAVPRTSRRAWRDIAALLFPCALAVACDAGNGPDRWRREGDPLMSQGMRTGRLADKSLDEASGAVASVAEPGVFWSQNDSGNDEYLFAYDASGRALGRVLVRGVKNRDWEALAAGPCAEGQCITIGDVGDNFARRDAVQLHQVVEPLHTAVSVPVLRTLTLRYADGPHDVEAMLAGPDGTLWLFTKRPQRGRNGVPRPVRVYEVPRAAWEAGTYEAHVVDSLPVTPEKGQMHDWITDGSLSPLRPEGGRRIALLSYGAVHLFEADPVTGRPGQWVARCTLPVRERTAEGLTWVDPDRLLIVTEGTGGAIYTGRCP